MSADFKINRIKSANRGQLGLLGEVAKTAQSAIPKLQKTAANRAAFKDMADSMSALGAYCRKNGFDPTRTFQYVANFDTELWQLVLDMFARYDNETGELMDDGLLYRTNVERGCLELNKDFFYALISYFEQCGVSCDMRGKIQLH